MLAIALFTASVLLFVLVFVLTRALDYVRQHPEVLIGNSALAYEQCQMTLQQVVMRSKEIAGAITPAIQIAWLAPNGHFYTVSGEGVEEHRPGRVYRLAWPQIGGVGVRMQPGFKPGDPYRDVPGDVRSTTGYSFFLLIVPLSGDTITIRIPTNGRDDAVDFVAQTLALAGHLHEADQRVRVQQAPRARRQSSSQLRRIEDLASRLFPAAEKKLCLSACGEDGVKESRTRLNSIRLIRSVLSFLRSGHQALLSPCRRL